MRNKALSKTLGVKTMAARERETEHNPECNGDTWGSLPNGQDEVVDGKFQRTWPGIKVGGGACLDIKVRGWFSMNLT